MAHRTNVTQVQADLETSDRQKEIVVDPVCGVEMSRISAKHLVFRGDDVFYFCSIEHKDVFVHKAA